jgi:hypothetical protein
MRTKVPAQSWFLKGRLKLLPTFCIAVKVHHPLAFQREL